jgi:virulence-associated protein VagC
VGVATAKLFQNGRSQAVRLPKEFRLEGSAVSVRREGDAVILEPIKARAWPKGYWRRWGKASQELEPFGPLSAGRRRVDLGER